MRSAGCKGYRYDRCICVRQIPRSRKIANPEISRKFPEIPEIELHLCLIDGLRTIINRSDMLVSGNSGSFRKFRH